MTEEQQVNHPVPPKNLVMTKEALISLLQVITNSDSPVETKMENLEQAVNQWYLAMDRKLESMIEVWETKIPDSEQYLYTLGLRRVRDILQGIPVKDTVEE
jgi:hypothetical protein